MEKPNYVKILYGLYGGLRIRYSQISKDLADWWFMPTILYATFNTWKRQNSSTKTVQTDGGFRTRTGRERKQID